MNKYTASKINGKRIDLHRLVMQKHLGRELTPVEVVHHLDGNKSNNNLSNLKLFANKAEHNRHHINVGETGLLCGKNKKKLINGKLKCFHCKGLKGLPGFVKRTKAHLGVLGICKECRKTLR